MIAWLTRSTTGSLASALAGTPDLRTLDLDAPLSGGEVTIDPRRVTWQGVDLCEAEAVVVERPGFAWPQARVRASTDTTNPPGAASERDGRALALCALYVAAERTRVLDHPSCAHYAAAPLLALDRCAAAGLAIHPWRMVALRPSDPRTPEPRPSEEGRIWLDLAGSDAWSAPGEPAPGEPGWSPEPFDGPVLSLLTVGGAVAGAKRYASAQAWSTGVEFDVASAGELDLALALGAASALEVSWLQADLVLDGTRPSLLSLAVGPALERWDHDLDGAVAAAFRAWLRRIRP